MANKNLISVLLCTKNNENSIERAVESILMQNYQNIELLILDDFSNDRTFELISKFKDSRIRIFQNSENLGLTKSLNILIKKSSGEFIARQDGDDFSHIDRLDKQLSYLKHKKLSACFTRAINIESSKVVPGLSFYLPFKISSKFKNPYIHGTLMIRKEDLISVGGYDEKFYYSQDYKLYTDLYKSRKKISSLNKPLYFLNTKNNISTNHRMEQKYYFDCARKGMEP